MRSIIVSLIAVVPLFAEGRDWIITPINQRVGIEESSDAKAVQRRATTKTKASKTPEKATQTTAPQYALIGGYLYRGEGEYWVLVENQTARSVPQTNPTMILTTPATVAAPTSTLYPVGIPTERTRTRALGAGIGGGINVGRFGIGASVGGCVGGG